MSNANLVSVDDLRKVFDIACRLQDSDQCEGHSTGDDCATGEIEHELFETLARVRVDAGESPRAPKAGAISRPAPVLDGHVLNAHDDCVSWCPSCRANRANGYNPDGTEVARG